MSEICGKFEEVLLFCVAYLATYSYLVFAVHIFSCFSDTFQYAALDSQADCLKNPLLNKKFITSNLADFMKRGYAQANAFSVN